MSSRALTAALLLLAAQAAAAVDWESFAAKSDHLDDPVLIQAMAGADLDTRLEVCRGVGTRADPYDGDLLESLISSRRAGETARDELLLRVLLAGVFDPSRGDAELRLRVDANRQALSTLASRMPELHDAQLIGVLVRIFPLMPSPEGLPALMAVGNRLVGALRDAAGVVPPTEMALSLDFLSSVEAVNDQDLLPLCTDIARLSREAVVAREARRVARLLATR
jgi:hypothetical protein